ncbi:MAG: hypothetical protein IJY62_00900 [Clostridia bacterium]|nr:hypothetical protein [Clostridia bacterium]
MRAIDFLNELFGKLEPVTLLFASIGISSVFFLCLYAAFRRRSNKRAKNKIDRTEVFTLPDRENTFVRDKLNTTLNYVSEQRADDYNMEEERLRLDFVRTLLQKLKKAPLSVGDRLEVNAVSQKITRYALQNRLTTEETRDLNDGFSLILKMSAKYSL